MNSTDPSLHVAVIYNPPPPQTEAAEAFNTEDGIADLAQEIAESLRKYGHDAVPQEVSEKNLYQLKKKKFDAYFNICDGDKLYMRVVRQLEKYGKVFTGPGPAVMALTVDKVATKKVLEKVGVPTPKWQFFRTGKEKLGKDLRFPLIVKPYKEDCSYGISQDSVVHDEAHLYAKVEHVRTTYKQGALVEEFIHGKEINCTVVGNAGDIEVFPLTEVRLMNMETSDDFVFDYESKWLQSTTDKIPTCSCPAPSIDEKTAKKIQRDAKKAFIALRMRDYARFDIRYNTATKQWYFLETNSNPSIQNCDDEATTISAQANGLEYEAFVREILEKCRLRYKKLLD